LLRRPKTKAGGQRLLSLGAKVENSKDLGQYGKYVCEVKRALKKKNKQRQYNQNIVKRVFFITKQTNYHINEMCAYEGLSERQGGRIIDKLVRNDRATKKERYWE